MSERRKPNKSRNGQLKPLSKRPSDRPPIAANKKKKSTHEDSSAVSARQWHQLVAQSSQGPAEPVSFGKSTGNNSSLHEKLMVKKEAHSSLCQQSNPLLPSPSQDGPPKAHNSQRNHLFRLNLPALAKEEAAHLPHHASPPVSTSMTGVLLQSIMSNPTPSTMKSLMVATHPHLPSTAHPAPKAEGSPMCLDQLVSKTTVDSPQASPKSCPKMKTDPSIPGQQTTGPESAPPPLSSGPLGLVSSSKVDDVLSHRLLSTNTPLCIHLYLPEQSLISNAPICQIPLSAILSDESLPAPLVPDFPTILIRDAIEALELNKAEPHEGALLQSFCNILTGKGLEESDPSCIFLGWENLPLLDFSSMSTCIYQQLHCDDATVTIDLTCYCHTLVEAQIRAIPKLMSKLGECQLEELDTTSDEECRGMKDDSSQAEEPDPTPAEEPDPTPVEMHVLPSAIPTAIDKHSPDVHPVRKPCSPKELPPTLLHGPDLDSIYFVSPSITEVIEMQGEAGLFKPNLYNHPSRRESGSRFSISNALIVGESPDSKLLCKECKHIQGKKRGNPCH